jgi:hypothetical protein
MIKSSASHGVRDLTFHRATPQVVLRDAGLPLANTAHVDERHW